jgi:2-phospho-L-lactate/phosphoenolpyruvate guanylyltransferase
MRTVAILPIKSFGDAKQRLAHELSAPARRALAEAMFSDVLVALRATTTLSDIIVVTGDRRAQRIADRYGMTILGDANAGHNVAASNGVRKALLAGAERTLLVPGDCPLLDPTELERLIARPVARRSVLIVPDRHGSGTNALLLTPPDALPPAFGPGSRRRHADNALLADAVPEVIEVSSLALDVDTPEDLAAVQAKAAGSHGRAARTREVLSQLARSLA